VIECEQILQLFTLFPLHQPALASFPYIFIPCVDIFNLYSIFKIFMEFALPVD